VSKQYKIQAKQIVLTRGVAENEDHVEVPAASNACRLTTAGWPSNTTN